MAKTTLLNYMDRMKKTEGEKADPIVGVTAMMNYRKRMMKTEGETADSSVGVIVSERYGRCLMMKYKCKQFINVKKLIKPNLDCNHPFQIDLAPN